MRKNNELVPKDLKDVCNPNQFKFETTKELNETPTTNLIYGQARAIKALNFGLDMDIHGYNIYVEGTTGIGKTVYTKRALEARAAKDKVPSDWCYIYNFDNPNEPLAISFPAGQGKVFQKTMETFVKDIRRDIKKTFNNEDFEKEKKAIKQEYDAKREDLLEQLNKRTMVQGYKVQATANGVYMMPVLDGKPLEEDEFEALEESVKRDFEERSSLVQDQVLEALAAIKGLEREADKKIEEWQASIAHLTIDVHINSIKANYKRNKRIATYLDNIKNDILRNISLFLAPEPDVKTPTPPNQKPESVAPWLNYRVNLFIDNSRLEGAPVITDNNYLYNSIFGGIEYENQYGAIRTDFTMLKPGLLHQANGGYIVFQARDLMANQACYEGLKRALRNQQIGIDTIVDNHQTMMLVSIKPEPIPLDLKVILIGSSDIYHTLLNCDPDFRKLFKVKVEFEDDAPKNSQNIGKLANFIRTYCIQEELMDLDKEAVACIVEYASKIAGDKEKISTHFTSINEVIGEAATWAKLAKSKIVTKEFVQKALDERIERIKKYDEKYLEMVKEETLLIDTEGYRVGQINGLTVISIGDYSFGKPAKVTANTYMGNQGIVNIEREVEMSGSAHSKGVMILSGYLGELFAQEFPISLTASVTFEQLYGGVDGDSASSTELYAILSSLSGIPINQSIAVTGSVNQKGEIQPIGGVNEKIEGFYQICNLRGLTGEHGVMIPVQNVRNLHLSDEIIESVRKGKFHIYAVSTIDEGIEILTGVPAGTKNKNGKFPLGTINYLAEEKLHRYYENNCNKNK
ncbi:MAG: AAA family ATPase [Clostridia bacterium]|nr:AAA family ATPase [Clostridia bacterium]